MPLDSCGVQAVRRIRTVVRYKFSHDTHAVVERSRERNDLSAMCCRLHELHGGDFPFWQEHEAHDARSCGICRSHRRCIASGCASDCFDASRFRNTHHHGPAEILESPGWSEALEYQRDIDIAAEPFVQVFTGVDDRDETFAQGDDMLRLEIRHDELLETPHAGCCLRSSTVADALDRTAVE